MSLSSASPEATGVGVQRLERVAVLGGGGLLGAAIVRGLLAHHGPRFDVVVFDEPVYEGVEVGGAGGTATVRPLESGALSACDVVICALDATLAAQWVPTALSFGAFVIDCSGQRHSGAEGTKVVASIHDVEALVHRQRVVSVPGSTAVTAVTALHPLHEVWGIERLVVSALLPASASGQDGIDRLKRESRVLLEADHVGFRSGDVRAELVDHVGADGSPFAAPLALNVSPWVGPFADSPDATVEREVHDDVREALGLERQPVSVTCLQVPVIVGETLSVEVRFAKPVDVADVRVALMSAPHVVLLDDSSTGDLPSPIDAVGSAPVFAGRIRQTFGAGRSISFILCSDNIGSGAARNAVSVAERALAVLSSAT